MITDILDWTTAEVLEAVLTHTVRAHPPPSPLGDRGYSTYAIWGPLHTSIVSAILCSLSPRDSTITVRHFLGASAAWLSHIWFSQDPTYRQITAALQQTYRDSEHGSPDPWHILRVPFTLACYPEALLSAWADLTCRPASFLDVFPDAPTPSRTPGPPARGGYWVTRVHEDTLGEYLAGMGRQAMPRGRGAGAHPRGPAASPPPATSSLRLGPPSQGEDGSPPTPPGEEDPVPSEAEAKEPASRPEDQREVRPPSPPSPPTEPAPKRTRRFERGGGRKPAEDKATKSTPQIDLFFRQPRPTALPSTPGHLPPSPLRDIGREPGWEDARPPPPALERDNRPTTFTGHQGNWLRPDYSFQEGLLEPTEVTNL